MSDNSKPAGRNRSSTKRLLSVYYLYVAVEEKRPRSNLPSLFFHHYAVCRPRRSDDSSEADRGRTFNGTRNEKRDVRFVHSFLPNTFYVRAYRTDDRVRLKTSFVPSPLGRRTEKRSVLKPIYKHVDYADAYFRDNCVQPAHTTYTRAREVNDGMEMTVNLI